MSMREALEACPFCGSEGQTLLRGVRYPEGSADKEGAVMCPTCEARAPLKAWNMRPPTPSRPALATSLVTEDDGSGDLISPDSEAAARIYDPAFIAGWKAARSRPVTAGAEPMAYYIEHAKHGVELSLDPIDEASQQRGWTATPLYAAPPAAAGREVDTEKFMEVVRSRWNFEEHEFDAIEKVMLDPPCVAMLALDPAVSPQDGLACDCQQPEEIDGLRLISNSCPIHNESPDPPAPWPDLCDDCPPPDYPTDKTRCAPCPRRALAPKGAA